MLDVDFVIDPTSLEDNDSHILETFLSQTDDQFIPTGFYPFLFDGVEKSLALTHSLVIKNATSFTSMGQIEILSQVAFEFFEDRSMFKCIGYLEPSEHFRLIMRDMADGLMATVVKIHSPQDQNAVVNECQLIRTRHTFCLGPMLGNELTAFITAMPRGLNAQEFIHRLNYRQLYISLNDRAQLTEKILRAYLNYIRKPGITHYNLNARTVYIDPEDLEINFIDYRTARSDLPVQLNRYIAPETLTDNNITPTSNLFALGLIIGELWGDIGMMHHKPRQHAEALCLLQRRQWIGLFDEMEMGNAFQQDIVYFLNQLTDLNPEERPTAREALKSWHRIQAQHCIPDISSLRWNDSPLALRSIYDHQEPPFQTPSIDTRERSFSR